MVDVQQYWSIIMHKVGIMMMFLMGQSPKKVKEIILEVEGKTKISNIAEYLFDMGKITNLEVELSLEKNGQPVSESSNITQALKYASPINGVLKLYLYEKGQYQKYEKNMGSMLELHSSVKLQPEGVRDGTGLKGSPSRSSKVSHKQKSPQVAKKGSDKSLHKGKSPQGLKKEQSPKRQEKVGQKPETVPQQTQPEVKSSGFCCC